MTEQQWLTSADPTVMLQFLLPHHPRDRVGGQFPSSQFVVTDRKLRLFAVALCRLSEVWDGTVCQLCNGSGEVGEEPEYGTIAWETGRDKDQRPCQACGGVRYGHDRRLDRKGTGRVGGLTDPRSRRAVEVAERYADGKATKEELDSARRRAWAAAWAALASSSSMAAAWAAAGDAAWDAARAAVAAVRYAVCVRQCDLIRDIFGNPFRQNRYKWVRGQLYETIGPPSDQVDRQLHWLTWNDGAVPKMAQLIYDDRAFDQLPLLGDMLEEAGCDNEDILIHCRGRAKCPRSCYPTTARYIAANRSFRNEEGLEYGCNCENGFASVEHARGCWVLDLILGKE